MLQESVVPLLIADNLGVCPIAAIAAHQQILLIPHHAVTARTSRYLNLIAQIHLMVFQQLDLLPIGQGVFQIDVRAIEQVQVTYCKVGNA